VSNARASRSNAAASRSPGCLYSLQGMNLAVRTLRLLGIFVALLVVLSQATSSESLALVVIACALIGIICVWWRACAVSFGGACCAVRDVVVSSSWRVCVVVVVVAAFVPGAEAVDNYPSAAAKAACDLWVETTVSNSGWWNYYKYGCKKYGCCGTLAACKSKCVSSSSLNSVR